MHVAASIFQCLIEINGCLSLFTFFIRVHTLFLFFVILVFMLFAAEMFQFLKCISSVTGKDCGTFVEQWVYPFQMVMYKP